MVYVVLGLFAALVLLSVGSLAWRLMRGGDLEPGGSTGHQLGREKNDWGPKAS